MRSIKLPNLDPMVVFRNITQGKEGERGLILSSFTTKFMFAHFSYTIEQLHTIYPAMLSAKERAALLHCYLSETNALKELKKLLKTLAGTTCPYCGVRTPNTIDHYIPKDQYPEFSVYFPNLVPCCNVCNTTKDENWANENGRMFFHAFFDKISDAADCIVAKVNLNGRIPDFKFELRQDANIPERLFEIISTHFDELKLLQLYGEYAGEEYSDKGDWFSASSTSAQLCAQIGQYIKKKREKEGPMSWRAAFWKSVLQSPPLIDKLIAEYV